jgi:RNA polymerase sigma factor (sigma-70 family)
MTETHQLLLDYKKNASDAAFRILVGRYVDLVYSTALRVVGGDRQLAEDVAQVVFVNLARKIPSLPAEVALGGWLHRDACHVAATMMRSERRRKCRESLAAELNAMHDHTDDNLARIAPILDEAIEQLGPEDRKAILLRFFEHFDFRSIAKALGTNEDAAQKRVSRAVERLRLFFVKRGVCIGATGLAALLSANAVQSAPIALGVKISATAALSATAIQSSAAVEAAKTLFMTTLQKTLVVTTLATTLGAGVYQAHKASQLQRQVGILEQEQAPMAAQMDELRRERDTASNSLAALRRSHSAELSRLRGEVIRLGHDSQELAEFKGAIMNDPTESAAKSWLDRVNKLKQSLAQLPNQRIPELALLSDQDWLSAVKGTNQLATDADLDKALSVLRNSAKNDFAHLMQGALRYYAQANNGQSPTDLSQLQSFFPAPVDDTVLQRYELGQNGAVTLKPTPLDDQDDTYYQITEEDVSVTQGGVTENTLAPALQAFAAANNGQKPADPSQLLPFVTTPEQQAALQRVIQGWPGR